MSGRRCANILASVWLALTLSLPCPPAQAQFWRGSGLPDAVEFGVRMEMGDLGQARAWLDRGLDPDFIGDRIGTGLQIAAWEGNVPLMELFVSRGADVNKLNNKGETALMHAAWKGRMEAVQWLLARGAKVNREPRQWTALHYAAFSGQAEVVDHLVERGADVNARSTNGSTPLMMAVYEGREPMVRKLLALGADPRARNDYNEGAMEWAFKHNHLTIGRLVGSAEEFAVAANRPKTEWPETVRSLPVATTTPAVAAAVQAAGRRDAPRKDTNREVRAEIDGLLRTRGSLALQGKLKEVQQIDRRISSLRFKLAKPGEDYRRPATLEISASRKAPSEQKTRLIVDPAKK
jgi:hypothetical protein